MPFVLTTDLAEFAQRTQPLLSERIERNIHATVLQNLLAGHFAEATRVLAYGVGPDGKVRFAALRTHPWFMLATELDDPGSAARLVEAWRTADPELPGVNAVPGTARAIAAAWSEQTGARTFCRVHEAIHVLDQVEEPARRARGELRRVRDSDRPLMIDWMRDFALENGTIPPDQAETLVDAPLARGALMVWEDGEPVSMVAFSPRVAGVVRIGPVFTPPERRCHGYATNMVAAVSRLVLADGAERCMLYTDLANPTSNKIYAEVGYRRVGDWEEHAFERA